MPKVSVDKALSWENAVFLDVRSEKEFEEDHIPLAISMPILDNEERHIVGYTYKQESRDKAYEIGRSIFDKKIGDFEKALKTYDGKKVIFYCFRGGMRSGCFVDYFDKKSKTVYQLDGGYKAYREHVRKELENVSMPKNIVVIYGLTGSGKTIIIRKLKRHSIDLEGMALHRSSLFGAVGLKPNTQKMFESLLLFELKKTRKFLIIEGESRKVGNIIIPEKLFSAMMSSKKISVLCSIETRAKRIVGEYFTSEEKISEVEKIVPKLKERLGQKNVDELLLFLEKKDYLAFSIKMLKEYYDPLYTNFAKDFKFEKEISCEDIDKAAKEIEKYCKSLN